jgi:hypothetical protein
MKRKLLAILILTSLAIMKGDFSLAQSAPACPAGQEPVLTHREGNVQYYKCMPKEAPPKPAPPKPEPPKPQPVKPEGDVLKVIDSCLDAGGVEYTSPLERDRLVSKCMQNQGLCNSDKVAEAISLRYKLNDLNKQVQDLQKQFALLNRSVMMNNAELDQWRGTTEEAVDAAWQQGKDMLKDEVMDRLLDKLGGMETAKKDRLNEIDADMVEIEANENISTPLLNELKKLRTEKAGLEKDLSVIQQVKDAKNAADAVDMADMLADQKYLETIYSAVNQALDNPDVQKALNLGKGAAKNLSAFAKYSKSIVDSAYNITAEACAWARINQMNQVNEDYLKTTQALSNRMKSLVQQTNEVQTKIKTEYQCQGAGNK